MTTTVKNTPIRIEGKGIVLGYDHIVSYINLNHKVVKLNQQLAEEFFKEGVRKVEGDGCGAWIVEKIDLYLRPGGISYSMVQSSISYIYTESVVLNFFAYMKSGVSLYC